jgi:predicted MFS family arabinose efflux permease
MNKNFWIIALISLINSLSTTVLIPTIYLYGRQFGLNDFQVSFLFSIYFISQFFATPVIGKLSDRFGRKPLLIMSLTGTVIANFIAGNANSASLLIFARFLDGITGGNVSVAQAVISDVTPAKDRARAFNVVGATFAIGFIVGPAISLMAQKISLGASFLVSSFIASFALIITIFFLPETIVERSTKYRNVFDLGLGKLVTALTMPKLGILFVINFLLGTTFSIFTFALQPYFIHVLKQNNESLTLLFLMIGVVAVCMQLWGVGLLINRYNLLSIFFIGLLIRSLSFMLMPLWENVIYFVIISFLFSLFNSFVQPIITTLISLNAKPQEQGIALGVNSSYLSISNAIGPVIAGLLVHQANPITYSYPLYLAGFLTLLVLILAIKSRKKYGVKENF